jgi:hypothetical protein
VKGDESKGQVEDLDHEQTGMAEAAKVDTPSGDAVKEQVREDPPVEPNVLQPGESIPALPEASPEEESSELDNSKDIDDEQSPENNMMELLTANCSGLVCVGGVIVSILLTFLLILGICRYWCGVCQPKPVLYQTMPEVEMTNGRAKAVGLYTDDFMDEDDDDVMEIRRKTIFKRV